VRAFPPAFEDRHYLVPVAIRTDYHAPAVWGDVVTELNSQACCFLIQGPEWDGAATADVLAVAWLHPILAAIFIADAATMASPDHAVLVVTTATEDDEDYAETIRAGRHFRALPSAATQIHVGLETLAAGFADYVARALKQPDRIFRPDPP